MAVTRTTSPGFIGRTAELEALEAALERARGGGPVVATVAGDAGIGKTRLLDEFCQRAFASGARVLKGASIPASEAGLPYAPVVQVLRCMPRERVEGLPDTVRAELAVLLPELGDDAPDRRDGDDLSRTRLFGSVLLATEELGREAPVVWALEDFHWADRSTQDLVSFLVAGVSSAAVLIVLTVRPDELLDRPAVRDVVADLLRPAGSVRIDVRPLSREETGMQIAALAGAPPDISFADRVFRTSEGNPFFTEELVVAGADRFDRGIVLARFGALGDAARALLRVAAAVGRSVDHDLLVALTGDSAIDDALREALDARVLMFDGDGYTFRHALLHEAIERELLPGERRRLHARIAAILAQRPDPSPGVLAETARHLELAQDLPGALRASVIAGIAADGVPAPAEAVVHYERALALWPQVPDPATVAGTTPAELFERAAEAIWLGSADAERASALFAAALDALDDDDRLKRADLISRQAQCAFERHAWVSPTLPLHDEAVAMLPAEPSVIKARVLARRATALMFASRFAAGAEQAREAIALARATRALAEEADASVTLFVCLANSGGEEEAFALIDRSRVLVEASGHPRVLQRWVVNALYVLQDWSRYDEALEISRVGVELLQRVGLGRIGHMCTDSAIASVLGVVGRLAEAEALIGHERSVLNAESLPIHFELAFIHLMAGELAEAAGDLDALGDPAEIEASEAVVIHCYRASIALWEGRVDEAVAAMAVAEPRLPAENRYVIAHFLSVAVRAHVEAGCAEEADRLLAHCEAILAAGPPCPPATLACVRLAHAERSRLERRPDPEIWRAVAEEWEALGHVYDGLYARWREAQALAALGGRHHRRIGDIVTRALGAAEAAGMQGLAAELRELGRRTGVRGGDEAEPEVLADLTQRERDVLSLICAGHSNRQIAEELFITTKTAGTHVSNILLKLGVPSRGAAAAAAHAAGFVARVPAAASAD